jgi:predicted kinase
MRTPQLLILCGVPGAGKTTLARHLTKRWRFSAFASETFADELGSVARTAAGDLSEAARTYAYSRMAELTATSLAAKKAAVVVGSFRSDFQRRRFRDIAARKAAAVLTIRILCPVQLAAQRVTLRSARGERGPPLAVIEEIDAELGRATDIDETLVNDTSLERLYDDADAILQSLTFEWRPSACSILRR